VIDLVTGVMARRVASYLATDGEVDLGRFHVWASKAGIDVYVPAVLGRGEMVFRRYHPAGVLVAGPLGTSHPPHGAASDELADLALLDVVVVPVVAFDVAGNRLGRGGGYYDRALAHRAGRDRPLIVGVAFGVQQVDGLVPEPHDVALDRLITELEVHGSE